MRIDQPSFSGSITQAPSAYADLSGSFTGSFTGSLSGSFIGDITVQQAEFTDLVVRQTLNVGTENTDGGINIINSGSVQISGSINVTNGNAFTVEGVDVLDSALAFSIALG
jgi:hypothetical protein